MSEGFLQYISRLIFELKGDDMLNYIYVFPNQRAGIFFRKYMAQAAGRSIFAPQTITINKLFENYSPLKTASQLELLIELYRVYSEVYLAANHINESFDEFLFWGKIMLSDFSEIDQQMVNVKLLYSNLSDLKNIEEQFQMLPLERQEHLAEILKSFQGENYSEYRRKFMSIWNSMYEIYNRFSNKLLEKGVAYTGLLQRDVLTNHLADIQNDTQTKYIFIGFNALSQTEKLMMQTLQNVGRASFCWDYDSYFLRDPQNRASFFMEENLLLFPNMFDARESNYKPEIQLLRTSSTTLQAAIVGNKLSEIAKQSADLTKIAVVLPDEKLLEPLLHYLPSEVEGVNITMGKRLQFSPIYSLFQLISQLLSQQTLQDNQLLYYYKPVIGILQHPYVKRKVQTDELIQTLESNNITYASAEMFGSDELLALIFEANEDIGRIIERLLAITELLAGYSEQDDEYLYVAHTVLNQLSSLLSENNDIKLQPKTFYNLLLQLISQHSVAFQGEPIAGLQIMGMLESRLLDFETVIITDANDDILPGKISNNSLIPYDIRFAYNLATTEKQDAVMAYNFYRLIANANQVILIENTTSNQERSGEATRYLYQLQHQYSINISTTDITIPVITSRKISDGIVLKKTNEVMQEITDRLCPHKQNEKHNGLSPSALNDYVACPLKFYLNYIKRIRSADHIEETLADNYFGTILHETMRKLYTPNTLVTEQTIKDMLIRLKSTDIVEKIYAKEYLKQGEKYHLEGKDYLPIRVIRRYVERILEHDKTLCPFRYIDSEKQLDMRLKVDDKEVYLKGVIDRIDEVNNTIRIIDYKTGSVHSDFPSMDMLFDSSTVSKSDHVRQTLNYCLLYSQQGSVRQTVQAHIYYVRKPVSELDVTIKDAQKMSDYRQWSEDYEKSLQKVLSDILNPDIPFTSTPNTNTCRYCPFLFMCGQ